MSYNKVIMMGRLTRDPELKTVGSDMQVAKFGLAVDSGWGDKKKTTFIDVTTWGKQAEFVSKHFNKGEGIHIEGRLDLDTWDDKESGAKRSKHTITAERITFTVGNKDKGSGGGSAQNAWDNKKEIDEIPF